MCFARPLLFALLTVLLAATVGGQQIASADLSHPRVVASLSEKTGQEKPAVGCRDMIGGVADGYVVAADQPNRIQVEILKIDDEHLMIGADVDGTIKLENTGSQPIRIPWSTDVATTAHSQELNHSSWETGGFRIKLKNKDSTSVELRSTSQILFASPSVSESTLTIRPGEWITVRISFRVEAQNPEYGQVQEGASELIVEWVQISRTREVKDCTVTFGYYNFDPSYRQTNPHLTVTVEPRRHAPTK
jgi:hypothetical protein